MEAKQETKFENHISVELDVLYQFHPYPANSIKINAYSKRLIDLGVTSESIKSFVGYQIDNVGTFPAYSDILTYLESKKLITDKNEGFNYPACKLCGNSQRKGMWSLTRDDGYEVAAICICNNEQSKAHYFRYDPNNPSRPNGEHRYLKAISFDYKRTPEEFSF